MPIAGRKPKPDGQKRNRVAPVVDWVDVLDVPFTSAPKMPAKMPDGRAWLPSTKRWWKAVSSMPHCALWAESDWSFAFDTLAVAAAFHVGDMRQAAELRNREKVLGTTVDFRRDLRIRYVTALPPEVSAGVSNLDDYRAALS